jgi:DNA-binding protein HU-beta
MGLKGWNKGKVIKIMAKMTKSQTLNALAEATGLSKKDVATVLDELTVLAYKEVKTGGEFVLPGFGKLVKAHRKARMGRNPATGEAIQIKAKTVVKFRLAKAAKDAVL